LLLDEPTNHLDLDMRHALAVALQAYEGALIIVSHDRHLMGQVADEFLVTENGTVQHYRGDLENYTAELKSQKSGQRGSSALSKKDKRRLSAEARASSKALRDNINHTENQITRLGKQLQTCIQKLEDPELYQTGDDQADTEKPGRDKAEIHRLTLEQSTTKSKILELENQWMEYQEQL